jgi:hypothetical protein
VEHPLLGRHREEFIVKTNRPTKIAITSGAAVLCLGVAAPSVAYACAGTDNAVHPATAAAAQFSAPTLQQEQAWIDSFVSHRTAWLDHLSAVVSADPNLTADQQSAALASIAKAKTALTDLKSAVDAATSTAQVHDIVKAALASIPAPWWPGPGTHHRGYHHHAHKFAHRDQRSQASPTDVTVRPADNVRTAHFTAWSSRDGLRNFDPAQHWSHRGDRGGDWGGHHDGGGHGGWGH